MNASPARLGLGAVILAALAVMLVVAMGGGASRAQVPGDLLSVSPRDDQLRLIDPTDASTISSTPITLAGSTVNGATGLAVNPLTGDLWALLKIDGGGEPTPRELVTIDPATGVATSVGSLTDGYAGIAFDPAGTLYAVTGDGATVSETLYTLSTSDGTATLVCALGNGTDGEAIAFNHSDGTFYHSSGHDGSDVVFETIDDTSVDPCGVTNIDVSGTALEDEEAMALTYWGSAGELLWSQNHTDPPRLFSVTPGGVPTLIGDLDHVSKGLAILVEPVELGITKTASPDAANVGDHVTFTIVVTNDGLTDATGVTVTDTLPAGVSYVTSAATQGSCSEAGGTVTCDLGDIAAGGSATIDIVVDVTAEGQISNDAVVSADQINVGAGGDTATAVLNASAAPTPTPAPTPTATPAQLPDTGAQPDGGSSTLPLAVIAAGLMAIAAGGFWVARRVAVRP